MRKRLVLAVVLCLAPLAGRASEGASNRDSGAFVIGVTIGHYQMDEAEKRGPRR